MTRQSKELRHSWKHNLLGANLAKLLLRPLTRKVDAYIFVATTGRSGTRSMQKVLGAVNGCVSFHEPYPIMNGEAMKALNNGNPRPAADRYKCVKSINIRRASIGHRYYAETNHMFIKAFVEPAIEDFGDKLKVIHLVRDPSKVAQSIASLEHLPGTGTGNSWYLDYHAPGNMIQIADVLDGEQYFNNEFCKSLWYWYEIESRVEFWKSKCPDVPFFDMRTDDLNNGEELCRLLEQIGLDFESDRILKVAQTRENRKLESKIESKFDNEARADMHAKFKQLLINKGYSLPKSLTYFEH